MSNRDPEPHRLNSAPFNSPCYPIEPFTAQPISHLNWQKRKPGHKVYTQSYYIQTAKAEFYNFQKSIYK